jgi:hypothetical protein
MGPAFGGPARRDGAGAVLALAVLAVAIALVYALMQGHAGSGALATALRATALRTAILAGQSALAESAHALVSGAPGSRQLMERIRNGERDGVAHVPAATRDVFAKLAGASAVDVEPVTFEVVSVPSAKDPAGAWQIDLAVRLRCAAEGVRGMVLSRRVRRRYTGRVFRIVEVQGPKAGEVVFSRLALRPDPVFEAVEP